MIYRSSANALAFERQHLTSPASPDEYVSLFRDMSPVPTDYWTDPGSPPFLQHRAAFYDLGGNDEWRASHRIAKGRFRNGGVGYVMADELELFAGAYRKDPAAMSFDENELLELLRREGPMTVSLIKKTTGMLVKHISPLLHKLAERFLVYEDQDSCGWDKPWYPFGEFWREADLDRYSRFEAVSELIMRFARMNVFISPEMIRSYYGFSLKDIKEPLAALLDERKLCEESTDVCEGYVLAGDADILRKRTDPPHGVFVLNRNDPLVRAREPFIKEKYIKKGSDVLYYVCVDGEICGAVMGKFRFEPNELHDVLLDLPRQEAEARRDEIIHAVYKVADQTVSPLMHYLGEINLE